MNSLRLTQNPEQVKNNFLRLLEAYAYCKVTKSDFRLSKILIFWLNFPSTMFPPVDG